MIRSVIKATLFFACVISIGSIIQLGMAMDLSLGNHTFKDPSHPYAWTPNMIKQQGGYELNVLQELSSQSFSESPVEAQRKFSLEVYRGDGLDDLRRNTNNQHDIILPDEDPDAYGFAIKQRF